ncbi:MAG: CocE/NonD family hydrolase, partial [Propionibacteriaceae bacterium]
MDNLFAVEQLSDTLLRQRVMVPMRDGVHLATDVYFAAALSSGEVRPIVFERTPYGVRKVRDSDQDAPGTDIPTPEQQAERILARGYGYVRQECRGRGDSEGEFVKYLNEVEDGADSIEWINAQSWCDGQVLTTGVSYSAHAQLATASQAPRGLAAMILDSGGFNSAFEAGVRMGGAFELKQVTWAVRNAKVSPEAVRDPAIKKTLDEADIPAAFDSHPWSQGTSPLAVAPQYEQFLLDQWRDEVLSDVWKAPSVYGRGYYAQMNDVPALFISSWYDPYTRSAIENFHAWQSTKTAPGYLVLGPWTHGKRTRSWAGDLECGAAATLSPALAPTYLDFRMDWFDEVLRQRGETSPAVRYFLMGGGDGTW